MNVIDTKTVIEMIGFMSNEFSENRQRLIELDSEMGDGDLGIYMEIGMKKGYIRAQEMADGTPGEILKAVGMVFAVEAPSTMGTLIGTAFMDAGKKVMGKSQIDAGDFAEIYSAMCEGIMRRGKASLGDKTILDTLIPAKEAAAKTLQSGGCCKEIAKSAYDAAQAGVESARQLKAVYGRPAYFGDATIGKYDGGTIVGMLICKAIYECLDNTCSQNDL